MPEKFCAGDIKKGIKKLVSEVAEISEEDLSEDAKFVDDLGVDSMKALEIVAIIEKKYKIVIPEDKISTIQSLQNIYELLDKISDKK